MRQVRVLGGLSAVLLCVVLGVAVWSPATSQDNYAERIAGLEARVTILEKTVEALQEGVVPPASTPVAETYQINGTFLLGGSRDDDYYLSERTGECRGKGGYDDLYVGAEVRVTDESGALLGLGQLEDAPSDRLCEFTFTVEVPRASFYMVAAGHAGREGPSFSFDEMVESDWVVDLSMG